jgi:excisionase family DNA binding protein
MRPKNYLAHLIGQGSDTVEIVEVPYLASLVRQREISIPVPDETPPENTNGLFTEAQAAKKAGVSTKTIRKLIKAGRLEAVDYGTKGRHHYRIKAESLAAINQPAPKPLPIPRQSRRRSNQQSATAALSDLFPRVS